MAYPAYGNRLLVSVLDELATEQPDTRYLSIPKGLKVEDGFRDVSYGDFARAVDHCAWHIKHELGEGQNFPTIGYIGPQDTRYLMLILACNKTGYKLFTASPRNTLDAHLFLLETLDCKAFIVPEGPPPVLSIIEQIRSQRSLKILALQPLEDLLNLKEVPPWRYSQSFEDAIDKPFVVLQTSGSTGMPKPIIVTQRSMTAMDALLRPEFSTTNTYFYKNSVIFLPFPLFHVAGISTLVLGMYGSSTIVFPPLVPLTAQLVDSIHCALDIQVSLLPPSILVDIAANREYLEHLRSVPLVAYGGGSIPAVVGEEIASRTHLQTGFGSTEGGWYALEMLPSQDWQYLKFNPIMGYEMHHHMDDLYQMQMHRDSKLKDFQAIFATFPDIDVYDTKDLFSKHPSKEDLWVFRGRLDDIIVYSTGEKMNPSSVEGRINGHPDVATALVYGQGRFQSALLLEPRHPLTEHDHSTLLTEKIWPMVQEANSLCPSYGRIVKEMILYTTPEKPLPRTGKGTVQRRLAYELYKDELDALYTRLEDNDIAASGQSSREEHPTSNSKQDLILNVVHSLEGFDKFDLNTNLHEHGIDSHQASTLSNRLKKIAPRLGISAETVTMPMIYESVTIEELSDRLLSRGSKSKGSAENMEDIFMTYTEELPITARQPENPSNKFRSVLLTGSTGTLGKYLLDQLLSDSQVEKVYCLGRGEGFEPRQRKLMKENGLQADFPSQRVTFLQSDLSKPYLGLPISIYHELLEDVTFIIHNAWTVDFNQSLGRIASIHIKGVKQFLQFSAQSKYGAFLFFISSISSVSHWQAESPGDTVVPEKISRSWNDAAEMGYSQSKNIAERIIDSACRSAKMSAAICRVGQIAGPTTRHGCWPKQEWLPSLIASSKYLGKMPSDLSGLGAVDWVPVDVVASMILTLGKHSASSAKINNDNEPSVYHIVNPNEASWSDLLPTIQDTLGVELVPSSSWLQMLLDCSRSSSDIDRNPGLKLINFFKQAFSDHFKETSVSFAVHETNQICRDITRLGPVDKHLMRLWLGQWSF